MTGRESTAETARARVESALAGVAFTSRSPRDGMTTLEVAAGALHEVCRRLRDRAGFETNTFVTAIDHFPDEPRFELVYQLLSVAHADRVRIVTRVRSDGAAICGAGSEGGTDVGTDAAPCGAADLGEDVGTDAAPDGAASVPTITDLWPGAAFSERECYDMFGIRFEGHPGLKRLLMPEDYDHFPLRKDFPHQGIEPDRLYREWERRRRERGGEQDRPRHPEDEPRIPPHEQLARA